jgi:hypothetical protein
MYKGVVEYPIAPEILLEPVRIPLIDIERLLPFLTTAT